MAQFTQAHQGRCETRGILPGNFSAAWVLANRLISSVIVGPRTLRHLEDVHGALDVLIDADDEAFIDSLVVPGHSSAPGFNDPGL